VGTPELVVEVSDGVSHGEALRKQAEKGVPEHITVNKEGEPTWFWPGEYHLHSDDDSVTAGTTFPGLKLNTSFFLRDDLKGQLCQLMEELGSDVHRLFEETLKASD
jgi:hypothetical protein